MTLPNLFLVGAPRCGTTTLHELLGDHPDVYMSDNKEPWFYALRPDDGPFVGPGDGQGVRDRAAYEALFADAGAATIVGESSTLYLASDRAPVALARDVPDARIVAVLRHPTQRAFSNYTQHRWQARETLSFAEAVEAGPGRVERGWAPFWDYRGMSRYGQQLARWYDAFPAEQIKIIVFDDLVADPGAVIADLYGFLGVDDAFVPSQRGAVNATGEPRLGALHGFLRGSSSMKRVLRAAVPDKLRDRLRTAIDRTNRRSASSPSDEVTSRLASELRSEVELAEQVIGRRLPEWL